MPGQEEGRLTATATTSTNGTPQRLALLRTTGRPGNTSHGCRSHTDCRLADIHNRLVAGTYRTGATERTGGLAGCGFGSFGFFWRTPDDERNHRQQNRQCSKTFHAIFLHETMRWEVKKGKCPETPFSKISGQWVRHALWWNSRDS